MKKRILPFRFKPKSVKRSSVIIASCGVALSVILFSLAILTNRDKPQIQTSSRRESSKPQAVLQRNEAQASPTVESTVTSEPLTKNNGDSLSPNGPKPAVDGRLRRLPAVTEPTKSIARQTAENDILQHPAAEFALGRIKATSFDEEGESSQATARDDHQRLPIGTMQVAKPLPYREREPNAADVGTPDSSIRSSRRGYAKNFGEKHIQPIQPYRNPPIESPAVDDTADFPPERSSSRLSLYPLKSNPVREFLKMVTSPNDETSATDAVNSQAKRVPAVEHQQQDAVATHQPVDSPVHTSNHPQNQTPNHAQPHRSTHAPTQPPNHAPNHWPTGQPTGPANGAPGARIAARPTGPRDPATNVNVQPRDANRLQQRGPDKQRNAESVVDVGPPLMPIVQPAPPTPTPTDANRVEPSMPIVRQAPPTDPLTNQRIANENQAVITRHLTPPHLDPALRAPIFELPNESYHQVLARPQPFARPTEAVPQAVAYEFPSQRREAREPISVLKSVTRVATRPTPVRVEYGPSYAAEFHRINEAAVAEHDAAMADADRHHGRPLSIPNQPNASVLVQRGPNHQPPTHQEQLPRHPHSRLARRPDADRSADIVETRATTSREHVRERLAMSQPGSDPPPILPDSNNSADAAAPVDNPAAGAEEIDSGTGERVPEIIRPMHTIDSIQLANLGAAEQKIYEKYDYAKDKFGQADEQIDARGRFDVTQTNYVLYGKSAQFCYRPVRFEQFYLERYGRRVPYVQPLISGAHFYTSIALWPASVVFHPPWQRECTNPDFPPPGSDASVELNQPPMAY